MGDAAASTPNTQMIGVRKLNLASPLSALGGKVILGTNSMGSPVLINMKKPANTDVVTSNQALANTILIRKPATTVTTLPAGLAYFTYILHCTRTYYTVHVHTYTAYCKT